MRAREFIKEARNTQGDVASGFDPIQSDPLTLTYVFPTMPANNPYRTYRFSMAVANHDAEPMENPTSQMAMMSAYTKEEDDMLKKAMKKTGDRGHVAGNQGSKEPKDTGHHSPVARAKRNRWGV